MVKEIKQGLALTLAIPLLVLAVIGAEIDNFFSKGKFKNQIKMNNKQRKQLVLAVANALCQVENRVTTREIKLNLHEQYPTEFWTTYTTNGVAGVSDMFHELVNEGHFTSVGNNGTYQTYASTLYPITKTGNLPALRADGPAPKRMIAVTVVGTNNKTRKTKTAAPVVANVAKTGGKAKVAVPKVPKGTKTISVKKAINLVQNNKGRFFTVTFTKKTDSTLRVMNAQYLPNQTITGSTVKVRDAALCKTQPSNCIRSFDMNTAHQLKIGGTLYRVK